MSKTANLNKKSLSVKAIIRFLSALFIIGSILFIPAGTFNYWNGWLFISSIFIPMIFVLIYLLIKDPELLEKRFKTKEKEKKQRFIQKIGIAPTIIGYLLPGFDYRFNWSSVPMWLVVIATILVVSGYILFIIVMKQTAMHRG